MNEDFAQIQNIIEAIVEDDSLSKNIRIKFDRIHMQIKNTTDSNKSLVINKILSDLEEMSNDVNMPDYVRTQIWHLTSVLETMA